MINQLSGQVDVTKIPASETSLLHSSFPSAFSTLERLLLLRLFHFALSPCLLPPVSCPHAHSAGCDLFQTHASLQACKPARCSPAEIFIAIGRQGSTILGVTANCPHRFAPPTRRAKSSQIIKKGPPISIVHNRSFFFKSCPPAQHCIPGRCSPTPASLNSRLLLSSRNCLLPRETTTQL